MCSLRYVFKRLCCVAIAVLLPLNSAFAVDEDVVISELKKTEGLYDSVVMKGVLTYERFLPPEMAETTVENFEYRNLGASKLAKLQAVKKDKLSPDEILSSTLDLSFHVEKEKSGRETVRYMSPRRSIGQLELGNAIDQRLGMACALPYRFPGVNWSELLSGGNIAWKKKAPLTEASTYIIERLTFPEHIRKKSEVEFASGEITFRTTPYWAVNSLALNFHYKGRTDTPVPSLKGVLEYSEQGGSVVLKSAVWEMYGRDKQSDGYVVSDRYTIKVQEMEFGVAHPDDFTLAGCGIKTINTAGVYSNIPLLAWYGGAVFVLCLVGLWLIRKRQRSAT